MNPHSFESLTRFAREHQGKRSRLADLRRLGKYSAYRVERFVGHTLQRAGLFDKVPNSFEPQHHRRLRKASFLFPWAVEQVKERYTRGLSGGSS